MTVKGKKAEDMTPKGEGHVDKPVAAKWRKHALVAILLIVACESIARNKAPDTIWRPSVAIERTSDAVVDAGEWCA